MTLGANGIKPEIESKLAEASEAKRTSTAIAQGISVELGAFLVILAGEYCARAAKIRLLAMGGRSPTYTSLGRNSGRRSCDPRMWFSYKCRWPYWDSSNHFVASSWKPSSSTLTSRS